MKISLALDPTVYGQLIVILKSSIFYREKATYPSLLESVPEIWMLKL